MSLQGVQKKVRGVVGRNPPTGITDLKTWDAFENETSLIWLNAREYNEDGSDIFNLSLEFEVRTRDAFMLCYHSLTLHRIYSSKNSLLQRLR
jgi:hypothetical protein